MAGPRMFARNHRYGYTTHTGIPVLTAPAGKQLNPRSLSLVNGAATSAALGFGVSFNSAQAQVYAGYASTFGVAVPYTGQTVLQFSGDYIYFQSKYISGFVSFLNANATGSDILFYQYWNGSAWVNLTPVVAPDFTQANTAFIYNSPLDWVVGNGGVTGMSNSMYTIRIMASGGFATPPSGFTVSVNELISFREVVDSKEYIIYTFEEDHYLLETGQSIIPYFGTASALNAVEISYKYSP